MSVCILASGDLHLGRRSGSLPSGVSASRYSPTVTWRRLVDEAIRRNVDLVCLTGDIIDQNNKYFEAFGPLMEGLRRLDEEDIQTYFVSGNHDYDVLPQLVDQLNESSAKLLGQNGTWTRETYFHQELPIDLLGWSFPEAHVARNPLHELDPQHDLTTPSVGLLHCDVDVPESSYAPVAAPDFEQAPCDIWLLGHIHTPHEVRTGSPRVIYPGSPHALDPGEQGAHGVSLLTIHSPARIDHEHVPLSPIRYENIQVPVDGISEEDEWREAVLSALEDTVDSCTAELSHTDLLLCKLAAVGRTAEFQHLEAWCTSDEIHHFDITRNGVRIRIRRIDNEAEPAIEDLDGLAEQPTPAGFLAQTILHLKNGTENIHVEELRDTLRRELRRINQNSTYTDLRDYAPISMETETVDELLLDRCYELLYALLDQTKPDS